MIAGYKTTRHFMERFKLRFYGEKFEDLIDRVKNMRVPTRPQLNRIKSSNNNHIPENIRVSGNAVFIVANATLITCWRINESGDIQESFDPRRPEIYQSSEKYSRRKRVRQGMADSSTDISRASIPIEWEEGG